MMASEGNLKMQHNLKVNKLVVNEFVKKLNIFSKHGKLQKLFFLFMINILNKIKNNFR